MKNIPKLWHYSHFSWCIYLGSGIKQSQDLYSKPFSKYWCSIRSEHKEFMDRFRYMNGYKVHISVLNKRFSLEVYE